MKCLPALQDYVQEYYHDPQGTMILCGFRDQIEVLSSLQSFEVDMSYKRIRSKDMNEVLFATFLPEESKSECFSTGCQPVTDHSTTSYNFTASLYQHGLH